MSDFSSWEEKNHCEEWLLFPENIGEQLSIDETSISNGDLYTIITNKSAKGQKGALVGIFAGTISETIISRIKSEIPIEQRENVQEVTVDMAGSMQKIAKQCFPKATLVIDRFHVQQLAFDAIQELRIHHRWEAIEAENKAKAKAKEAKENNKKKGSTKTKGEKENFTPEILSNGDTLRQLLIRSRYLLFKSPEKWNESQRTRAEILFERYPDIKKAYKLSNQLKMIYSHTSYKEIAYTKLAHWYKDVEEAGFVSFNTIANTIQSHYKEILNFFNNRSTNASAESFNAKIKAFRTQFRGVTDNNFFLFRLVKIYA